MIATHRLATPKDATRLFELRRESIIALAPHGMSVSDAEIWAKNLSVPGMERKIRKMEILVAEINGKVVGWGAIRGDWLEGLYTDPDFADRGIGTELLNKLEVLMRTRGIRAIRAKASLNAEGFYLRRGYEPLGPPLGNGRQIIKRLA